MCFESSGLIVKLCLSYRGMVCTSHAQVVVSIDTNMEGGVLPTAPSECDQLPSSTNGINVHMHGKPPPRRWYYKYQLHLRSTQYSSDSRQLASPRKTSSAGPLILHHGYLSATSLKQQTLAMTGSVQHSAKHYDMMSTRMSDSNTQACPPQSGLTMSTTINSSISD